MPGGIKEKWNTTTRADLSAKQTTVGITAAEIMEMKSRGSQDLAGRGFQGLPRQGERNCSLQATNGDSYRQENTEAIVIPEPARDGTSMTETNTGASVHAGMPAEVMAIHLKDVDTAALEAMAIHLKDVNTAALEATAIHLKDVDTAVLEATETHPKDAVTAALEAMETHPKDAVTAALEATEIHPKNADTEKARLSAPGRAPAQDASLGTGRWRSRSAKPRQSAMPLQA